MIWEGLRQRHGFPPDSDDKQISEKYELKGRILSLLAKRSPLPECHQCPSESWDVAELVLAKDLQRE
jgi:hypothetical protein